MSMTTFWCRSLEMQKKINKIYKNINSQTFKGSWTTPDRERLGLRVVMYDRFKFEGTVHRDGPRRN
jgi:hypothetical protein